MIGTDHGVWIMKTRIYYYNANLNLTINLSKKNQIILSLKKKMFLLLGSKRLLITSSRNCLFIIKHLL